MSHVDSCLTISGGSIVRKKIRNLTQFRLSDCHTVQPKVKQKISKREGVSLGIQVLSERLNPQPTVAAAGRQGVVGGVRWGGVDTHPHQLLLSQ